MSDKDIDERTFSDAKESHELLPLTAENIRDIWTKTYNVDGLPDWGNIYPYYHPDIVFADPIQRHEGLVEFKGMCEKLAGRCEQLHFDIEDLVVGEKNFFMQWTMTLEFRRTPKTPMYGCSKFTFSDDGRIIGQRDYYDMWGDVFANVPVMKKLYPAMMKKLFA